MNSSYELITCAYNTINAYRDTTHVYDTRMFVPTTFLKFVLTEKYSCVLTSYINILELGILVFCNKSVYFINNSIFFLKFKAI